MKRAPLYILSAFIVLFAFLGRFESAGHFLWERLTVLAQLGLVAGVVAYWRWDRVREWVGDHATLIAFVVTLAATTGSLFYSEIAGYTPCKLCWFQRVFMYPLPLLLGIAHWKRESIGTYVRWMASLGGVIALLHYLSQFFTKYFSFMQQCGLSGADCTDKLTFFLGYVTIPMMALTAFLIVLVLPYDADHS